MKKDIFTSNWSVHHPNADWNIEKGFFDVAESKKFINLPNDVNDFFNGLFVYYGPYIFTYVNLK